MISSARAINEQKIALSQYVARMNVKLLRPANFSSKLRQQGVAKKVTVQKICKVCKHEKNVRRALDEIWNDPSKATAVLVGAMSENQSVYEFERILSV